MIFFLLEIAIKVSMKASTEMRCAVKMENEICEVASKMKSAIKVVTKMETIMGGKYGSSF